MMKPTKWDALLALAPNSKFVMDGDGTITNHTLKGDDTLPSESEIDTKLASMISDWDAQAYSRNRQVDYPNWGTQLNKIYDDGITQWKSEMVDPVKAKWPKDNSGPVE